MSSQPCQLKSAAAGRGLTLLELLIVGMIVGVLFFIAWPTLQPSDDEALVEFTKTQLRYLYNQENAYFTRHGRYAQFTELAADPELGPMFDSRFAAENPLVDGVKFNPPRAGSPLLEITAIMPDGGGYIIDSRGEIRQYRPVSESDETGALPAF